MSSSGFHVGGKYRRTAVTAWIWHGRTAEAAIEGLLLMVAPVGFGDLGP